MILDRDSGDWDQPNPWLVCRPNWLAHSLRGGRIERADLKVAKLGSNPNENSRANAAWTKRQTPDWTRLSRSGMFIASKQFALTMELKQLHLPGPFDTRQSVRNLESCKLSLVLAHWVM